MFNFQNFEILPNTQDEKKIQNLLIENNKIDIQEIKNKLINQKNIIKNNKHIDFKSFKTNITNQKIPKIILEIDKNESLKLIFNIYLLSVQVTNPYFLLNLVFQILQKLNSEYNFKLNLINAIKIIKFSLNKKNLKNIINIIKHKEKNNNKKNNNKNNNINDLDIKIKNENLFQNINKSLNFDIFLKNGNKYKLIDNLINYKNAFIIASIDIHNQLKNKIKEIQQKKILNKNSEKLKKILKTDIKLFNNKKVQLY